MRPPAREDWETKTDEVRHLSLRATDVHVQVRVPSVPKWLGNVLWNSKKMQENAIILLPRISILGNSGCLRDHRLFSFFVRSHGQPQRLVLALANDNSRC